jgi:hypothetical protein
MQKLRRFAKIWDLIGNSGNFRDTTCLLWTETSSDTREQRGPFAGVMEFANWLFERTNPSSGLALKRLAEYLSTFLISEKRLPERKVLRALSDDFFRLGRFDKPAFLSDFEKAEGLHRDRASLYQKPEAREAVALTTARADTAARQARHLKT